MHIPFLDNWRRRFGGAEDTAPGSAVSSDPDGATQLLSECELLRERAGGAGVELDDSVESLTALDQLLPDWREDPHDLDTASWLGTDAGLYLGTVIVRTVAGARWRQWPDGQPVVRLPSGRDVDVLAAGASWAESGSPELSQLYAEASED
ncbi:DUF6278 family protein [Streptomyces boncukensis]|uniref:DUF3806 domain-containing protein n=1 Tax=Streptomyces boncukensis TaxID=2711219 RepID=A0A6G4WRU5_9ACTN|nr:DUF6278 family protein [Streptomyces boncukensis]NGO67274.1 hypothetical protein [Streptomyces boncukensis]